MATETKVVPANTPSIVAKEKPSRQAVAIAKKVLLEEVCEGKRIDDYYVRDQQGHLWSHGRGSNWDQTDEERSARVLGIQSLLIGLSNFELPAMEECLRILVPISMKDPFRYPRKSPFVLNFRDQQVIVRRGLATRSPILSSQRQRNKLVQIYKGIDSCPSFNSALKKLFAGARDKQDLIRHFFEVLGYAMQEQRTEYRLVIFSGPEGSGKTSLLKTFGYIVGGNSTIKRSFGNLEKIKLPPHMSETRLLQLHDDVDKPFTVNVASAGRRIQINGKPDAYQNAPHLLSVISTKNTFSLHGKNLDLAKRVCVFPMSNPIPKKLIDPSVFPICWTYEMKGIISEAIEGLKRLQLRGGFLLPDDCKRALNVVLSE